MDLITDPYYEANFDIFVSYDWGGRATNSPPTSAVSYTPMVVASVAASGGGGAVDACAKVIKPQNSTSSDWYIGYTYQNKPLYYNPLNSPMFPNCTFNLTTSMSKNNGSFTSVSDYTGFTGG